MTKSCTRDCRSECTKPGKAFDFVSTSRRWVKHSTVIADKFLKLST
jgi:hypothetical protein